VALAEPSLKPEAFERSETNQFPEGAPTPSATGATMTRASVERRRAARKQRRGAKANPKADAKIIAGDGESEV